MTYRTKRPRIRSLLIFGAGATLAITQLGAGCVPPDPNDDENPIGDAGQKSDADDAADDGGTSEPGDAQ